MNPFNLSTPKANFFGRNLIEGFLNRRKRKPSSYSRMKLKQIKARRAKKIVAYKSRRKNRIISKNLHAKLV